MSAGGAGGSQLDGGPGAGTLPGAMKRLVVVAAVLVVGAVVALLVRRQVTAGPGRIDPTLTVALPVGPDGGRRVTVESTVQLQVGVSAPAYVYVFDEFDGVATLVWPHVGDAWQPGVYESESAVLEKSGLHRLVVITAPAPQLKWEGGSTATMLQRCPTCEAASVTVEVYGEKPRRDYPKLGTD